MDGTLLGKRIKEARLAKKMTQSDVVGGYITRNMLSQIESGAAFPSIRTLEYLSGVLGVPMAELMSGVESAPAHPPGGEQDIPASLSGVLRSCVDNLKPYMDCASPVYGELEAIVHSAEAALKKI